MRITTYGHAIILSIMGLWISLASNGLIWSMFGGTLIGFGLLLARQAGREEKL
jgi:NO-binding membrane sensor protein with MHYT domain